MAGTPKERALGRALRQAREDKGLTLRQLGAMINRDHGVVSRWETGDRRPKPDQVGSILTALSITGNPYEEIVNLSYNLDDPTWIASTLPDLRQLLSAFIDMEQKATRLVEVAPLLIPGPLQTDDYVRAIMNGGGLSPDEIAARTAIRIGRRANLTRPTLTEFVAIIGEAALHQEVGGEQALSAQLHHLLELTKLPKVHIRIVSFKANWHTGLEGSFFLMGPQPVVLLENRRSAWLLHEPADVRSYELAVDRVLAVSLDETESARLIARVANGRRKL